MMRLSSMNVFFVLFFCLQNSIESLFICQNKRNVYQRDISWTMNDDDSSQTKLSRNKMTKFFQPVCSKTKLKISSGLSFDDGDQLLVSAQKPLGLILEEGDDGDNKVIVTDVLENSSASRAGIQVGDWLVAIQNADVSQVGLDEILRRIGDAPRVVNLRFHRNTSYVDDYDD